jgi:ABC-type oligopeptide transport system ATPase subunit
VSSKISVKAVSKVFDVKGDSFQALHDINLEVCPEEFLCIVGPSGCGKSTSAASTRRQAGGSVCGITHLTVR